MQGFCPARTHVRIHNTRITSQHFLGCLLVVPRDNLPTHETYHLLAPSGPRCVRASSHLSHSTSNLNTLLPLLPLPAGTSPSTSTTTTSPTTHTTLSHSFLPPTNRTFSRKRSRVQLGCAPRLVSRVWRRSLARRGCVICGWRVLDACIR